MKKFLLFYFLISCLFAEAQQPILDAWMVNTNGALNEYWENSNGNPNNPSYVHHFSTDSANVLALCYSNDSVWVRANGLPDSTGKYSNPGAASAQSWTFRFPRNSQVATNNVSCPNVSVIGVLINGLPIYGKGDATSWDGNSQTNANNGAGLWNVNAWYDEGFTLDSAYGAHPAQAGDYHSHAVPKLLYEFPSTTHSPIVGFALDGYPIYGPYGYISAMDSASGVTRIKTSYSLRNITQRHVLPNGTNLAPQHWGPDVNSTYELGMYNEDYEYIQGWGDLDEFNGRFCVTPEYPNGTYAYFVTADANGDPEYPYYIGNEYYGIPDSANFYTGAYSIEIPQGGVTCVSTTTIKEVSTTPKFEIFPNPTFGAFMIRSNSTQIGYSVQITNTLGRTVYIAVISLENQEVLLENVIHSGFYFVSLLNRNNQVEETQKLIVQ